ncbi:integrase catalytic domain-containing protein [Trichonephila clavipes]|nr:integrase catalytic domain-containing protein [Trichonephila clavipes]
MGADIMGKLLTGKRKHLTSSLVTVETQLRCILMGKVPQINSERFNLAMTVTSLFIKGVDISDLWGIDVIGIKDPMEKISKNEIDLKTKEHFNETVKLNQDNHYEVCHGLMIAPLSANFNFANKRLEMTTEILLSRNLYGKHENVFQEWLNEGIFKEVPSNEVSLFSNYLPHRPVIKDSSSTNSIRAVFDTSAKLKGYPFLNQCLQYRPNLIELIPDILARFRAKKFGTPADIRKAILQISVSKEDFEITYVPFSGRVRN